MSSLFLALLPHLKREGRSTEVTITVLNAISELALIGGVEVVKTAGQLVPYLLDCLKDSTNLQRREAALRSLSNLCQSSAYVVEPYRDQPEVSRATIWRRAAGGGGGGDGGGRQQRKRVLRVLCTICTPNPIAFSFSTFF